MKMRTHSLQAIKGKRLSHPTNRIALLLPPYTTRRGTQRKAGCAVASMNKGGSPSRIYLLNAAGGHRYYCDRNFALHNGHGLDCGDLGGSLLLCGDSTALSPGLLAGVALHKREGGIQRRERG